MKILNYGSLNMDYVYSVHHIVQPGETILSTKLEVFCGGKGLNQSIALARAGAEVYHAGMIGADGSMLLEACQKNGVNAKFIRTVQERSGNAIIQVDDNGQNSIVLFGGANQKNSKAFVDETLALFNKGDWILLQNEINLIEYIIEKAALTGLQIALNPSPYNELIKKCDLDKISLFFINEIEAEQITKQTNPDKILQVFKESYPNAKVALTLGKAGAIYMDGTKIISHGVYDVPVIDTTAAGDTFTGFFLAALARGDSANNALSDASAASSLAVSKTGAVDSIPLLEELEKIRHMKIKFSN